MKISGGPSAPKMTVSPTPGGGGGGATYSAVWSSAGSSPSTQTLSSGGSVSYVEYYNASFTLYYGAAPAANTSFTVSVGGSSLGTYVTDAEGFFDWFYNIGELGTSAVVDVGGGAFTFTVNYGGTLTATVGGSAVYGGMPSISYTSGASLVLDAQVSGMSMVVPFTVTGGAGGTGSTPKNFNSITAFNTAGNYTITLDNTTISAPVTVTAGGGGGGGGGGGSTVYWTVAGGSPSAVSNSGNVNYTLGTYATLTVTGGASFSYTVLNSGKTTVASGTTSSLVWGSLGLGAGTYSVSMAGISFTVTAAMGGGGGGGGGG